MAVATSGAAKSVVGTVADKVVVEEALVKAADLDPSYWAYWLSTCGYTGQAGEWWCPHARMHDASHTGV